MVSVSKGGVEIEDIETKQIIKLIASRTYSPKILFFNDRKTSKFLQTELFPDFNYIRKKSESMIQLKHPQKNRKILRIHEFLR